MSYIIGRSVNYEWQIGKDLAGTCDITPALALREWVKQRKPHCQSAQRDSKSVLPSQNTSPNNSTARFRWNTDGRWLGTVVTELLRQATTQNPLPRHPQRPGENYGRRDESDASRLRLREISIHFLTCTEVHARKRGLNFTQLRVLQH
jgi:hypothetical protein